MPVVRLTDIAVRAFKPGEERVTYWDETLPAFGVRVGRRAKVFILMHGKSRKRIVIGRYPAMSGPFSPCPLMPPPWPIPTANR